MKKGFLLTTLFSSLLAGHALAYDFQSGDLCYNITSDSTVEVTYQYQTYWYDNNDNYEGLTVVTIPRTVTFEDKVYFVTGIGYEAFLGCYSLKSITIPETVTHIDNWAFPECDNIEELTYNTNAIGSAFGGKSSLKIINIGEAVTTISSNAFNECTGIKTLYVPNTVKSIEPGAFRLVKNIVYSGTASGAPWGALAINGIIDGDFVFHNNDKKELVAYIGDGGDVVIPNSVDSIGFAAFYGCVDVASINIPSCVKGIDNGAFRGCINLTSINIPNGITRIGDHLFLGCSGLRTITIPNSVTSIGIAAFYESGLESIELPSSITSIESMAFDHCRDLLSVTISNGVTDIGTSAFSYCDNLVSVVLPESVKCIGWQSFEGCNNLKSIHIPQSVESIGFGAFQFCYNLDTLVVPNSVTDIGNAAFTYIKNVIYTGNATGSPWGALNVNGIVDGDFVFSDTDKTKLTAYIGEGGDVVLPENVSSIGEYAFMGCYNIKSVTIPKSITSIGQSAFLYIKNVIDLSVKYNNSWGALSINGTPDENGFIYADNSKSIIAAYVGDEQTVVIPNTVRKIGHYAFSNCSKIKNVVIPNSVSSIGECAFYGCNNLISVTLPYSVTNIGRQTFVGCSKMESITIPKSITNMEAYIFYNCPKVTLYVQNGANKLNKYFNWNCSRPIIGNCIVANALANDIELGEVSIYSNNYFAKEPSGNLWYLPGTENANILLTANAKEKSHFKCWDDGSTDNPRIISVTQDTIITALFEAHTVVIDEAVSATCTESGKTEGKHCSVCNEELVEQTEIPALGHNFIKYVYNNDATTAADGTETAVCEHGCGATDTRVAEGTKLPSATAVSESVANAITIYAHGRTIVVENATEEIRVYNAMGALVGRDVARNVSTITVDKSGVYIVKIGSTVNRVVIN